MRANEQSPKNIQIKSKNLLKTQRNKQEFVQIIQSENKSEAINQEIPSNTSCVSYDLSICKYVIINNS
jgi:hypothetical protein